MLRPREDVPTRERPGSGGAPPRGPLAAYRVLDLSDAKGQFCARLLGDLGANVVLVEPPGGQPDRRVGPFYHDEPHPERSLYFFALNTSKRSITLDITQPDGQDLLKRLAARADFLVESFPPGYMDSLGLGYDELSLINPRLVMASVTPFGPTGPYSGYRATDIVMQAMGGVAYTTGDGDKPPLRIAGDQSYLHAGLQAAAGCLVAHLHRQTTGRGQQVDVSLQEAMLHVVSWPIIWWSLSRVIRQRFGIAFEQGPRGGFSAMKSNVYPCKDGFVHASPMGLALVPLFRWMEENGQAGHLAGRSWKDVNFETLPPEEREEIEGVIAGFFREHTRSELFQEGLKLGVVVVPLLGPDGVVAFPQFESRGFFQSVEQPNCGRLAFPGVPSQFSLTPWSLGRPPLAGEHNDETYQGELGLSSAQLQALKGAGVV
ncbi:MAG: CoA transferase [Chloroflexi bacterium]|nr:CoA transferase [Chloroflexota bacterium]